MTSLLVIMYHFLTIVTIIEYVHDINNFVIQPGCVRLLVDMYNMCLDLNFHLSHLSLHVHDTCVTNL